MAERSPFSSAEPSAPHMRGPWMHFDGVHEGAFRRDYEASGRTSRSILLGLAMVLIALTPTYDSFLLQAPAGFLSVSHRLQFGVQVPSLLIALLITVMPQTQRFSVGVTIAATVFTGLGLFAQRVVGVAYDFHVPHDFAAFAAAMTFFLARIRFRVVLPWMLLLMAISTLAELVTFQSERSAAIYNSISAWMLFCMAATGAYLLERLARQHWATRLLLEHQASHDALTGVYNRRQFHCLLERMAREAIREGKSLSLLLIDIDDFKAYNDHYGHPMGDECLRRIGGWLASNMRRPRDFAGRLGGEEFAACWFDVRPADALHMAEQLRGGIGGLGIPHAMSGSLHVVTASSGYVHAQPGRDTKPEQFVAQIIRQADTALYLAKREGRNCLRNAAAAAA